MDKNTGMYGTLIAVAFAVVVSSSLACWIARGIRVLLRK
jgi:hypothetical protein